jgi:restriction system protein
LAIPDYQALMLPMLKLAAEGETRVPVAAERIADGIGLTEAEREELLPSGKQRVLDNRLRWAKFYMTRAGLIDSPARGRFTASEAGRALLAKKPDSIDVETLKGYHAFAEWYARTDTETGVTEAPETEAVVASDATPAKESTQPPRSATASSQENK